jgi:protocatechuate 3,4-dioxygenase beta subunit
MKCEDEVESKGRDQMENTKQGEVEDRARRRVIGLLVGTGSLLAIRCGDSSGARDGGADSGAEAGADAGGDAATDACNATPEGEIGPYFADDSDARFNRSNILSNVDGTATQTGIALALTIIVVDGKNGCVPYANAQVDIWHCNAAGVYSDQAVENTSTETWLRGYQATDANGRVSFGTIIPGWYAGRTTHIHLRVRSSYSQASSTSDGTNTTQLFFAQTFIDGLATSVAPYNAEGTNPTTNAGDHVYAGETKGANVLALSGDNTNGYTAAVTVVLPITSSGSGASADGGPPRGGPGGGGSGGGGPPAGGP